MQLKIITDATREEIEARLQRLVEDLKRRKKLLKTNIGS
jgi:hypothetical protein